MTNTKVVLAIIFAAGAAIAAFFYASNRSGAAGDIAQPPPTPIPDDTGRLGDESVATTRAPDLVRTPPLPGLPAIRHVIRFDNGREVTVELRKRTVLPFYFQPTQKLIDMYSQLEAAAYSGEAIAAVQLYNSLKACAATPATRESLAILLLRARDEGLVAGRKSDALEPVPVGFDYSTYEKSIRKNFEFCNEITSEQRQDYRKWAEMAAYAGNYWGIRFLTEELGPGQESYELWKTAWTNGQINAATAFIVHFRQGYSDPSTGEPDYVRTYAWQLIRNKIYDAAYGYSSHPSSARAEAMAGALHATAGYLSPHEQRQAENLAADLLESNPNCCIGNWPWP